MTKPFCEKALPKLLKKYIVVLFPSIRAYFNFWMLFVFLFVLFVVKGTDLVLISALAICYFLNEWLKEFLKK